MRPDTNGTAETGRDKILHWRFIGEPADDRSRLRWWLLAAREPEPEERLEDLVQRVEILVRKHDMDQKTLYGILWKGAKLRVLRKLQVDSQGFGRELFRVDERVRKDIGRAIESVEAWCELHEPPGHRSRQLEGLRRVQQYLERRRFVDPTEPQARAMLRGPRGRYWGHRRWTDDQLKRCKVPKQERQALLQSLRFFL